MRPALESRDLRADQAVDIAVDFGAFSGIHALFWVKSVRLVPVVTSTGFHQQWNIQFSCCGHALLQA